MTKEQKDSISGYIRRCIPDIARKCGVSDNEVILVMSEFIPCEIKHPESDDDYVIIQWPEIQDYMDIEGLNENAHLINDEPLFSQVGSSAYFVKWEWIKSLSGE